MISRREDICVEIAWDNEPWVDITANVLQVNAHQTVVMRKLLGQRKFRVWEANCDEICLVVDIFRNEPLDARFRHMVMARYGAGIRYTHGGRVDIYTFESVDFDYLKPLVKGHKRIPVSVVVEGHRDGRYAAFIGELGDVEAA